MRRIDMKMAMTLEATGAPPTIFEKTGVTPSPSASTT